jgi:hypothetical protein
VYGRDREMGDFRDWMGVFGWESRVKLQGSFWGR